MAWHQNKRAGDRNPGPQARRSGRPRGNSSSERRLRTRSHRSQAVRIRALKRRLGQNARLLETLAVAEPALQGTDANGPRDDPGPFVIAAVGLEPTTRGL